MSRKIDSRGINSKHFHVGQGMLTRYLRLNSCSLLLGSLRSESTIRNRRVFLFLSAFVIFIIGITFVVF